MIKINHIKQKTWINITDNTTAWEVLEFLYEGIFQDMRKKYQSKLTKTAIYNSLSDDKKKKAIKDLNGNIQQKAKEKYTTNIYRQRWIQANTYKAI